MLWVRVADYKDVPCNGCTCCFVTLLGLPDDVNLCDECEHAEHYSDYQVACAPTVCNFIAMRKVNS